ncbi:MAG: hypothetical protein J0I34_09955 [Pseudonocardia sp.]|uniref:hypothetical protein n=1 Tax=unclassified Pseudonocardia TaxID=2619320 RepID=UPI00086CF94B|nr:MULTISPECIES: hypothetical protein [unclassified Pseudonocardia]MBN9109096.1 hypothetical protein [Pseudonocardia sp.]ODU04701.1 MAG: hypothetical protein ABS80_25860 [Pseudonocardia sp. SCN 72-51]ODV02530.1 MAG: hypothetical protein ABT15_25015 [Pseudonocardia sp. SCN 73-27]
MGTVPVIGWVLIGVAAWIVVSVVVVLLLGRMIRARDAQVPRGPAGPVVPPSPTPVEEAAEEPPAGRTGRVHRLRDR